jgi:hypothetical protein
MFKFFCFMERLAYPILFFAVLLSTSAAIQAEEPSHTVIVNAMGRARISEGNTVAAREQAISDGLVSALEHAVGNVLPLDPLVQNFHKVNEILYDKSDDFIREYRVLAETRYENFYRIMLQASVSIDNLKQWLSDTGVIPGKSKKLKILFLIAKQHPKDTAPEHLRGEGMSLPETEAERTMAETMREKGFLVLEHEVIPKDLAGKNLFNADFDDKTAVNIGRHGHADVVIVGKSNLQESMGSVGSGIKSFKGTVELRALRTDTGEIIASVFRTAAGVNPDERVAKRNALSDAAYLAGEVLADGIASVFQVKKPEKVKIIVKGTSDLANFVIFRNAINNMPEVSGMQVMEMMSNEAVVLVDFKGNAGELSDVLMLKSFDSFTINIFEVSENELRIELVSGSTTPTE